MTELTDAEVFGAAPAATATSKPPRELSDADVFGSGSAKTADGRPSITVHPSSPAAYMAIDLANQTSAASQRTTPHIDAYKGKLLSSETFQDDAGNIQFRDPQSGNIVNTDNSKHVALRDPNDNTVKVYSRDAATNESPVVGLSRVLSPGLASGAPTARPVLGALAAKVPSSPELLDLGKQGFRAAEAASGSVPPEGMNGLAEGLTKSLKDINSRDYLAPQTFRAVKELGQDTAGNVADIRGVRQLLGDIAQSPDKFERRAASHVIGKIDEFLNKAMPESGKLLEDANANYAAGMRAKQIDTAADVADLRAGRAGYGGNSVNTMRQVLSPIVEKAVKGNAKGFSKEEIGAMREIVEGNAATNTLRGIGQFSPAKGILATTAAIASGGTTALIGAGANKLATMLTSKQIDRLNELVRKRSPAYQNVVTRATERYFTTADEFKMRPTPERLIKAVMAARVLSNGLTRDGIQVSSGHLLKSVAGQDNAAANEQQPPVIGVGSQ